MSTKMVALVGEQPIPVLLPVRALNPERIVFVHTNQTEKVARRVAGLVSGSAEYCPLTNAYDLLAIHEKIAQQIKDTDDIVFNITGGTKIMALAAYALAAERKASFVYYQTEGARGRDQQSILYQYRFNQDGTIALQERRPLSTLLSLDDYLQAHVDGYEERGFSNQKGGHFERVVAQAIEDFVDEVKAGIWPKGVKEQVDIDLMVRCGNHIAVLEVKGGGEDSGKKAVDQLTTAAAREYLGTYATRVLVISRPLDDRYKSLAQTLRVRVVELPNYRDGRSLNERDSRILRQALSELLPCGKRQQRI